MLKVIGSALNLNYVIIQYVMVSEGIIFLWNFFSFGGTICFPQSA